MQKRHVTEWWQSAKKKRLYVSLLFIAIIVLSYFLLIQLTKPESYNVQLFSVAEKTIRSPQTVEDTKKTEEEQQKAMDAVPDVYTHNRETGQNRVALVESLFDYVNEVNKEASEQDKENAEKAEKENKAAPAATTIDEKVKMLKSKLSDNVSEKMTTGLSDNVFRTLLEASSEDLNTVEKGIVDELTKIMDESIRDDNLNSVKVEARDDIELSSIPSAYKDVAKSIISYAIIPNETYNKEQTEERKKEAAQAVSPVKILQGQVIVQEGQIVDRESYRQLKLLHLLDQKMPVKQYLGYGLFVLALAGLLYFFTKKQNYPKKKAQQRVLIFSSIYVIMLLVLWVIRILEAADLNNIAFLFPAALAPMMAKILLNEKYAFLSLIYVTVTSLFVFQSDSTSAINLLVSVFILLSGLASISMLKDYSKRSAILQSGLWVGLFNMLFITFLLMINNSTILSSTYLLSILYGFVGGFGSFVIGIGLIPLFETVFGVLTTSRLVELASPNHPLLKKILMKAPGTYHHSMMVANLAEACADQIGANSLLVRVGCFYHDIGKTLRPPYFVENQLQGINPHDRLTPKQSRDIILAHTTDGAEILKENHMPQPIIDIAAQHHGTTLLKYFYYKEKETNPEVTEAEFRYPGPKPQTTEVAIINIADSVEAAVRACAEPTKEKIQAIVDGIIQDRLLDRQFSECEITLAEIEVIRKTLNTTLNGIYHQRIQYPDDQKGDQKNEAARN
ncbi:HD family phosphohydrolase [Listeria costaricensis]|uniref:HD family phosphohydrolase n=1 Tax=Listeria costaricensis TaxID=2026604 RepID=UPI000C0771E9|nr:HD family phosphohydrolase [Listeria costaricensis]